MTNDSRLTQDADYAPVYRLFIYGGDTQDFNSLDALLAESRKLLDPSKALASSVTIEVIDTPEDCPTCGALYGEMGHAPEPCEGAQIDSSGAQS